MQVHVTPHYSKAYNRKRHGKLFLDSISIHNMVAVLAGMNDMLFGAIPHGTLLFLHRHVIIIIMALSRVKCHMEHTS